MVNVYFRFRGHNCLGGMSLWFVVLNVSLQTLFLFFLSFFQGANTDYSNG